jgi:hypothetical protein
MGVDIESTHRRLVRIIIISNGINGSRALASGYPYSSKHISPERLEKAYAFSPRSWMINSTILDRLSRKEF